MSRSSFSAQQLNIIGPSITTSVWSSGPPASPSDGDIWIATGVDTNGTCWQFQYRAGSVSTLKWELIGGSPIVLWGNPAGQAPTVSTWTNLTNVPTFTAIRGGDYNIPSSAAVGTMTSSIANSTVSIGWGVNGTNGGTLASESHAAPPSTFNWNLGGSPAAINVSAGAVISLMGFYNSAGYTFNGFCGMTILARRVS